MALGALLTCGLLGEHDFGLGREVLSRKNHLLAAVHQAAGRCLAFPPWAARGRTAGLWEREKELLVRYDDGKDTHSEPSRDFTGHNALCPPLSLVTANAEPSALATSDSANVMFLSTCT